MSKEWFVLKCVICSKVASWYDLEGDSYCERCKEDYPDEQFTCYGFDVCMFCSWILVRS